MHEPKAFIVAEVSKWECLGTHRAWVNIYITRGTEEE
jgi:hypothetical protein